MAWLKADLHIHAREDPVDRINYSSFDLIDKASKLGFDVLAFTFHEFYVDQSKIVEYGKRKGILVIPGAELLIEGKEVLVYNLTRKEVESLRTFDDLRRLRKKRKDILIIAPHPYFEVLKCLGPDLESNIDLFDGIEYSWFYSTLVNKNKLAELVAKNNSKALIATSDCHWIRHFGKNYTLINSKKDMKSVFDAIRKRKVKVVHKPVSIFFMIYFTIVMFWGRISKIISPKHK